MDQFKETLSVDHKSYHYHSLKKAETAGLGHFSRLPFALKVLLENLLRNHHSDQTSKDIAAMSKWLDKGYVDHEIAFRPTRVLMQDFTGVPAVADLCAMRDAVDQMGLDPLCVNPLIPVDLVIDHSVMVDHFANKNAFKLNVEKEFSRNKERYEFLRWGQKAFDNFTVVPPGTGICHQVNIEYLARVVWSNNDDLPLAYCDSVVGTDSHTTMVNGLGVLGWGVGGIEAEAAMLGQPISMLIPEVVGMYMDGHLREGVTSTDLVLRVVELLRKQGVVGKFVEFFGPGVQHLSLADRATIANMAPEYGATCGIFAVDHGTLDYLHLSGRDKHQIALVEQYMRAQNMFGDDQDIKRVYTHQLTLDMGEIRPAISGPKRPQDRLVLDQAAESFSQTIVEKSKKKTQPLKAHDYALSDGDVVIAAITSCTNTSNPFVLIGAGLLAKKAIAKGLSVKPWVKTSLAPGSQVVSDYLERAGLNDALDQLGFHLVGYGCTTCIGNSGPLPPHLIEAIDKADLSVCSVLSGNRNFEGRINAHVKANYLASPPLVVAYALAGSMYVNLQDDPIGYDQNGKAVMLKDIWPTNREVEDCVKQSVTPELFKTRYSNVFEGTPQWQSIKIDEGKTYEWDSHSTYVQRPPFFDDMKKEPELPSDIKNAKILVMLGDSITTDHISPAGSFASETPAGKWLSERQIRPVDFNSYGSRRGNHEVMMRGTFANIRLRNELLSDVEGGYTLYNNQKMSIFEVAQHYAKNQTPLIVIAGKAYGTGSSRDWAAKGTRLLGIKAVIAESFERIHRSNLIGMGVLPLQFKPNVTRKTLALKGDESFDLIGISQGIKPKMTVQCVMTSPSGEKQTLSLLLRIDTKDEANYYIHGGILQYVLRQMTAN
ncbi:MAG: aconitate hydratase AcnA [Pseudomonadota bacterium]